VEKTTRIVLRKSFLVLAAIALIVGVALLFLIPLFNVAIDPNYYWIFPVAGGVLAISFFIAARDRHTGEDTSKLEAALDKARRNWKARTGLSLDGNYENVLEGLGKASEDEKKLIADLQRVADDIGKIDLDYAQFEQEYKNAKRAYEEICGEKDILLKNAGVQNSAEYGKKLGGKDTLKAQLDQLNTLVTKWLAEYNAPTLHDLEYSLNHQISEINEQLIDPELDDFAVKRLENTLAENKNKLGKMQQDELGATAESNQQRGTLQGLFHGIPEKIVEYEKGIIEKKQRLSEINDELQAYKIAEEIFNDLASDSETMLQELSDEIGDMFSSFIDNKRKTHFTKFDANEVKITDAAGELRTGDNLSSGTKDCFFLAARLVLASKSLEKGKQALIVLDEPFIALDTERTKKALAILYKFHQDTRWQIIIFTKDERSLAEATTVFGSELKIHHLRSGK
jgi:DNA repair exonuclease SbcCD ATPase subunit